MSGLSDLCPYKSFALARAQNDVALSPLVNSIIDDVVEQPDSNLDLVERANACRAGREHAGNARRRRYCQSSAQPRRLAHGNWS
jgi:hypothetical protein